MEKKKIFMLIGILWLAIIVGFIATKEFTLRTGSEVLLKTIPVDPRDLFRGDYVILWYEISTLDLNKIPADYTDIKFGDKIWVSLRKEDGYGVASKIYRHSPENEKLFLKGTVKNIRNKRLTVEYGIESYFVPEGKGKKIERARRGEIDIKVSIDKFGSAAIKSLLLKGKEVRF